MNIEKVKTEYWQELKDTFTKIFHYDDLENKITNKSSTYLLPMIGDTQYTFRSNTFPFSQFRAVFIGDKVYDNFEDHKILLLYRFSGREEFIKFENYLADLPTYIDKYEPDSFHTMYVFDIPVKWKDDFNKFLKWKPSEFSEDYKKHLLKFYAQDTSSPLYQTLYKTEERFKYLEKQINTKIPRELEASSSPYWEIEYYQEEFKRLNKFEKAHGDF